MLILTMTEKFIVYLLYPCGWQTSYKACRYCISYGSDEVLWELLIFSLCVFIGDSLSCEVSGIFHNPLLLSLGTWTIILHLFLIVTYCALRSAVNPESNDSPT